MLPLMTDYRAKIMKMGGFKKNILDLMMINCNDCYIFNILFDKPQ